MAIYKSPKHNAEGYHDDTAYQAIREIDKAEYIQRASESQEQQALFQWAAYESTKYPELALLYHIPNEGKRTPFTGRKLKSEGLKPGVPDICLPVSRGCHHGLYIEMKATNGRLSKSQEKWISDLKKQGYLATVCFGFESAREVILAYLA